MVERNHFDDEDLMSGNTNKRNWRGILIALLVIILVLVLIITSVIVLTPQDDGPRIRGYRLRMKDILRHDFQPSRFNGSWISDHEIIFRDQWGGISLMNVSNLSTRVLMNSQTYVRLNPMKFELSPDQRYLLLAQNVKKLFKHSYLAQYTVLDMKSGNEFLLDPLLETNKHPYLLLAKWTPQGHGLIMVQNYDIYYKKSPSIYLSYRITNSAVPGIISHGVPNWLYEEEILGTNRAIWMSRDGLLLAFATFNDSSVKEFHFSWYGCENQLYAETRSLRYPRPGTKNSEVKLTVADLADISNIKLKSVLPPTSIMNSDFYLASVTWISLTEIFVSWLNRQQNSSLLSVCTSPKWDCKEIQRITGEDRGWIYPSDRPLFGTGSASYIITAPVKYGSAGAFRQAVAVNIPKKRVTPLTNGRSEVTRILSWDHENDIIYYLAIPDGKPSEQHLYRTASLPPRFGSNLRPPVCLTCTSEFTDIASYTEKNEFDRSTNLKYWNEDITVATSLKFQNTINKRLKIPKPQCLYHDAIFSPLSTYFILECLGPGIPAVFLFKTNILKPKLLITMQNNSFLRQRIKQLAMPQIRTFPVQISRGYSAQVRLHLPPGLRDDEITKYPLIVHVYGSPGSQLVTDKWKLDWNAYLAGAKDFIIAQIDGRGSGGQGDRVLHEIYYKLGTVEVSDQLEVTEYLCETLHFIDRRRIGVWGWGYGAFVAALALAHSRNVFKCGISVAPVTNWEFYDSAYAERYMGLPNITDNYKGYEEADVTKKAHYLHRKMFYLIHGSADDNVHFQHSMSLMKSLSEAGVLFRQQIYPDEAHDFNGVKMHLYSSMGQFFEACLRKPSASNFKPGLTSDTD